MKQNKLWEGNILDFKISGVLNIVGPSEKKSALIAYFFGGPWALSTGWGWGPEILNAFFQKFGSLENEF